LAENRPQRPKHAFDRQRGQYPKSGGSRLAFVFVSILFVALVFFFFNTLAVGSLPTPSDPISIATSPRTPTTKLRPAVREASVAKALPSPDFVLYLPIILR